MPFEIATESEREIAHERASSEKAPLSFWKARAADADGAFLRLSFSLRFSHSPKKSIWRRTVEKLGNNARQNFDEATAAI